jgi:2-amino-4-hydroxy-6-hydroxymethyldihydropteridine diphosphokinase
MELTTQPWFLNCAVKLETTVTPEELLHAVLAIEESMGRRRVVAKGPRAIDIDILLYGDAVIDTLALTVPHPALAERRFVLAPLAEIAEDSPHPLLHRTMRELLLALPASAGEVRIHMASGWINLS